MKSVQIYVRGITDTRNPEKEGKFIVILHYQGFEKVISGKETNTTSNRVLIKGIIEAIKMLKEPCKITIYTHCNFGISEGYNGINKDIVADLLKLIKSGGHKVDYIIGYERQRELINKLRSIN